MDFTLIKTFTADCEIKCILMSSLNFVFILFVFAAKSYENIIFNVYFYWRWWINFMYAAWLKIYRAIWIVMMDHCNNKKTDLNKKLVKHFDLRMYSNDAWGRKIESRIGKQKYYVIAYIILLKRRKPYVWFFDSIQIVKCAYSRKNMKFFCLKRIFLRCVV